MGDGHLITVSRCDIGTLVCKDHNQCAVGLVNIPISYDICRQASCIGRFLIVKALLGAINKEMALLATLQRFVDSPTGHGSKLTSQ